MKAFTFKYLNIVLSAFVVEPKLSGDEAVIICHGAGLSNKGRVKNLAIDLADKGYSVWAFDFRGHGESEGELGESSLDDRLQQALAFYGIVHEQYKKIHLWGFSMSGQTICDLTKLVTVSGLGLFGSAAYGLKSRKLRFDSGFTEHIRLQDSWKDSSAFSACKDFAGPVMLIKAENEDVIPPMVTSSYEAALKNKVNSRVLIVPESPHQLAKWLNTHENPRKEVIEQYVSLFDG